MDGVGAASYAFPFANDIGWLASGSPRSIASNMYPELGETIATYLKNIENNGVPQTVTEVQNESGIEAGIQYANASLRSRTAAVSYHTWLSLPAESVTSLVVTAP
jgi:O-glycosyl hydrolase